MKQIATLLLGALFSLAACAADQAPFTEGEDYLRVTPAQPTSAGPGEVEVIEFFWYGCPHCFDLEPMLSAWVAEQPGYVKFRRIPGTFNPVWQLHAKAYFAAEQLGVLDRIHKSLFTALHVERRMIDSEEELAAFFQENAGVTAEQFRKAFSSFSVNSQVQRAEVLARRFRISGVPSLIINGKYVIEPQMAGSYENMLAIADYLIAREKGSIPEQGK